MIHGSYKCKFWKKTTRCLLCQDLMNCRDGSEFQPTVRAYRPNIDHTSLLIFAWEVRCTYQGVRNTCVKFRTFVKHTPSTCPTSKESYTDGQSPYKCVKKCFTFYKMKTIKMCDSKGYSYVDNSLHWKESLAVIIIYKFLR